MKDAEQPGAHLRPPLEPLDRVEERHKDLVRQVLCIAGGESHSTSRTIESPGVPIDDVTKRSRIARPE